MTIRHLTVFAAVAEQGSMSAAPKHLYLSQPTVSQAIRELEAHYNGLLFERLGKKLYLTERGKLLLPHAREMIRQFQQLEELILDRETYALKEEIGAKFASLVYEGKWFSPLREAEQAFIESTQRYVTGTVKLGLYKGNIIRAGETSPYTMYNESIASFKTGDMYDHTDANGFINLFGLSTKVRAMKMQEVAKKEGIKNWQDLL